MDKMREFFNSDYGPTIFHSPLHTLIKTGSHVSSHVDGYWVQRGGFDFMTLSDTLDDAVKTIMENQ